MYGTQRQRPLWLADDLFLITLDDRADRLGRLRLADDAFGFALSGALIGELACTGNVVIDKGVVYIDERVAPPYDDLARRTLATLSREQHALDKWIPFLQLNRFAIDAVARRLRDADYIDQQTVGLRRRVVYPPVDGPTVYWRSIRLARLIEDQASLDPHDEALLALVDAAGLRGHVFWNTSAPDQRWADERLGELASSRQWRPWSIHQIAQEVKAQIGRAAINPR
jgi:hypothetical protein